MRIDRHEADGVRWEIAHGAPAPRLRAHVLNYAGYAESSLRPVSRCQLPFAGLPLIFSFGPTLRIGDSRRADSMTSCRSFVAGLWDGAAITEYQGAQHGMQVNFTPLGAFRFLGLPLDKLANRVVELEDLLGVTARRLASRLEEAPGWPTRIALLDRLVAARLAEAPAASREIRWAWRKLEESEGSVTIGALCDELGWSRKRLVARFREQIGLPPKTLARLMRFNRAQRLLTGDVDVSLAEVAQDCGYYDQAHFNRDFREFAGSTPGELLHRRLPGVGAVSPA